MYRWMIGVLVLCFLGAMTYGCVKDRAPDMPEQVEARTDVDSEVGLTLEELNEKMVIAENLQSLEGDVESSDEVPKMLQEHVVFKNRQVFYLNQSQTYAEDNNGDFILEAWDKNGDPAWVHKWKELEIGELPMGTEPVVDDDQVFIGVYGSLFALDLEEGDVLWEATGTGSTTKPLVYEDTVYIASYNGPFLTAVDKPTGRVKWILPEKVDQLSPVKIWRWKNSIWVACESAFSGKLQYVKVGLNGDILDYRGYARNDEMTDFFIGDASGYIGSEAEVLSPENVLDGEKQTAWGVTNENNGVGEWLSFNAEQESVVHRITLFNGHQGDYERAETYGKLKTVRFDFSNGDSLIYRFKKLDQLMSMEKLVLARLVVAYEMRLTVLEVQSGTGEGIALSEIVID